MLCSAFSRLVDQTLAERPNSDALARATASSAVLNVSVDRTGPKISSRAIDMSAVTPEKLSGVIEPGALSDPFAAKQQFGAVGLSCLDVGMHFGGMGFRDHGADFGALVQRIAESDLAGNIEQTVQQRIADALLHQKPAAGNAALAGIVVDAVGDAVGCCLQIRIGEDDLRTLAAEFQADALDAVGRRSRQASCRPALTR